ncbi:amidohydrolase, partial [Parapusillimonas sp. SGNA-6]|nr:amidohydrolase [Parapusillimonas sp. SGNA-6]
ATADNYNPSVYNDPVLTGKVATAFRATFGEGNVVELPPEMFGEDFSNYTRVSPRIPTLIYSLGTSAPFTDNVRSYHPTHSSKFSPVIGLGLTTGIRSMSAAIFSLLNSSPD